MKTIATTSKAVLFLLLSSFLACDVKVGVEPAQAPPEPPIGMVIMKLDSYPQHNEKQMDISIVWSGKMLKRKEDMALVGEVAFQLPAERHNKIPVNQYGYASVRSTLIENLQAGSWEFSAVINDTEHITVKNNLKGGTTAEITLERGKS